MASKVSDTKIITALALCGSVKNAAASLNLSSSAIYQRLQNSSELKAKLTAIQSTAIITATTALSDAADSAITVLREVCTNAENPPGTRVSAADALLRHTARFFEQAALIPRLEALEQEAAQLENTETQHG